MFCAKCGSQNAAETKYCRGCGADLNSSTGITVRRAQDLALAEKQIDLYGSGMRGVIIGAGFVITSAISYAISIRMAVLSVFMLAFASYFLGTGVSRLLQARAMRHLVRPSELESIPAQKALPDYARPPVSVYETDDLEWTPASVTEHTTTLLDKEESNQR